MSRQALQSGGPRAPEGGRSLQDRRGCSGPPLLTAQVRLSRKLSSQSGRALGEAQNIKDNINRQMQLPANV